MISSEVRLKEGGIIKIVAPGIQERVTEPVVEVPDAFLVSPEELYPFGVAETVVIKRRVHFVVLHQVVVFLVVCLSTKNSVVCRFLISEDVMCGTGVPKICCVDELRIFRL